MTREKVDAILNDLREEESRLKNELAELNKEMRETTKELKKKNPGGNRWTARSETEQEDLTVKIKNP